MTEFDEAARGTGRTTKQIKDAPHKALFIWCNDILGYPQHLARDLGRGDLTIYGPSVFDFGRRYFLGLPYSAVVIDHAFYWFDENRTQERCEGLAIAQIGARPKERETEGERK